MTPGRDGSIPENYGTTRAGPYLELLNKYIFLEIALFKSHVGYSNRKL